MIPIKTAIISLSSVNRLVLEMYTDCGAITLWCR